MQSETVRIVFVMPRCRHDHIRAVHKQAYSLRCAGYEVVLVVKEQIVDEYLGMRVVAARAKFESIIRPILNLPSLSRQVRELQGDVYVLRRRMGELGERYVSSEFNWERTTEPFHSLVNGPSQGERIGEARLQ